MDGVTGIVFTVICALVVLVLGILNYSTKRAERDECKTIEQTTVTVNLVNIQKELVEIKALLIATSDDYKALERRVFIMEQRSDENVKNR